MGGSLAVFQVIVYTFALAIWLVQGVVLMRMVF